jgi:D-amino-acid dehydrogenase
VRASQSPKRIAVVGAGMLGLSTAWFLQEHGAAVTVVERATVAAGASWGNAGWITPGLAAPLPEPAILRAGLRALATSDSPLSIPLRADPGLLAFLCGFALRCTARRWQSAMTSLAPLSRRAIGSYEKLADGGVQAQTVQARPLLAGYRAAAQRQVLLAELEHITDCGGQVEYELLDGPAIQQLEPALSGTVRAAVQLHGQRYIDPGAFAAALADSVRRRGGVIREGIRVTGIREDRDGVLLRHAGSESRHVASQAGHDTSQSRHHASRTDQDASQSRHDTSEAGQDASQSRHDAVVLATGAWLGELGRAAGVRMRVQPGRGYSFSVPLTVPARGPVYFPSARLACTPMPGGRVRVAGMMEFQRAEAPPDRRRFSLIADAVRPLLTGAQLDQRTDEWVGSRPCTPDGLPLIGAARSRRVFVAGGHGMWGITLGPVTGQLLAQAIISGALPPELAPFNPLR